MRAQVGPTRRAHIGDAALLLVTVAVILHYDTLNWSAEEIKPGLLSLNLREEWLYLLLHALSSAVLTWFAYRNAVRRQRLSGARSPIVVAVAFALAFQALSEVYQTMTLPYHQPLPDFLADVLGIACSCAVGARAASHREGDGAAP